MFLMQAAQLGVIMDSELLLMLLLLLLQERISVGEWEGGSESRTVWLAQTLTRSHQPS